MSNWGVFDDYGTLFILLNLAKKNTVFSKLSILSFIERAFYDANDATI